MSRSCARFNERRKYWDPNANLCALADNSFEFSAIEIEILNSVFRIEPSPRQKRGLETFKARSAAFPSTLFFLHTQTPCP